MIALQVACTLLREVVRALLSPLRLLLYLPRRHHWRAVAREVLDGVAHDPPGDPAATLAEFFGKRAPHGERRPHLFVSAGELSGEAHAARLVAALPEVRCSAFGGSLLASAGAAVRVQLSESAVMGFRSVVRHLPLILRAFADYLRVLRDDRPDLVVLVDYPGLHVVMAKAAKRAGVPVLHYVAPQYWAWGPWRMRRYRRALDATLTILPFETAFFRRFDVPAAYIGHPLLDELDAHPPDPAAVAAVRVRPTLVLLPGSRSAEIRTNLPGMLRVAAALRARDPAARVVVVHKNPRRAALVRELLAARGDGGVEFHEGALAPWLAGARLVLAKSGTGSLEACLHGVPTIVVFHLRGPVSTWGYHNILSVPWVAAANLIAGARVVPEHLFHGDGGWRDVQADADRLWHDGPEREQAIAGLAEVRARLGAPGATARVAAIVRTFLGLQVPA